MQSFYTILNDLDILEVSGEDSEKFLQGQLTCDLQELAVDGCQLGATCTNKGRVFSSFRLFRRDAKFSLVMQPGMFEITRQALQKYIPFYKATMADGRPGYFRIGLVGADAEKLLADQFDALPAPQRLISLDDKLLLNLSADYPRYELWLKAGTADDMSQQMTGLEEQPLAVWQAMDVEAGICMIGPADIERHTPEELNMDLAGFVSFHKGCYTGQEIVARMHFRGKAKKRMYLVSGTTGLTVRDNNLVDSSGNNLGQLFNVFHTREEMTEGFAILNIDKVPGEGYCTSMEDELVPVLITPFNYVPV